MAMVEKPDAADLLAIARQTFLESLLPHVPEDKRYAGLMLANAMAIARREIAAGDESCRRELAALVDLYGEAPPPAADAAAVREALEGYAQRLVADIRAGRFDRPEKQRIALRVLLFETTLQRLRINNPKHLKAEGLE
jgi:hypothetical protein